MTFTSPTQLPSQGGHEGLLSGGHPVLAAIRLCSKLLSSNWSSRGGSTIHVLVFVFVTFAAFGVTQKPPLELERLEAAKSWKGHVRWRTSFSA